MLRARAALGMNRAEFAAKTDMSPSSIEYIENGSYGALPERVVVYLSIINPNIVEDYQQWKITSRLASTRMPKALPDFFPELEDVMHPHEEWRKTICGMPLNVYCAEIKVARVVVQQMEKMRQPKFPQELTTALIMTSGPEVTDRIRRACDEYARNKEGTNRRRV